MAESVRVLVVDDSLFMCRAITRMIKADPALEVVGVAHDGLAALEAIERLAPDVVTMDVEMPVMGGLEVLRKLSGKKSPPAPPVIVLSSITQAGSAYAVDALELGAFELVSKPDRLVEVFGVASELQAKIRAASQLRKKKRRVPSPHVQADRPAAVPEPEPDAPETPAVPAWGMQPSIELIVIGVSTGGPGTLQSFLPQIPADYPIPVVVAQHMPPGFTRSLAERLNSISRVQVREAAMGDRLEPGKILIAPAGWHLLFERGEDGARVALREDSDTFSWYRPSVDVLFESAAANFGPHVLALVLTGLGCDGTKGAAALKAAGGTVWAQDEETSVVYGMPRSVKEAGFVDKILALPAVGPALCRLGAKARREGRASA